MDTVKAQKGVAVFEQPITQDLLYLLVNGKKILEFFGDAPEVVFKMNNPIELAASGDLNPKWQLYNQDIRMVIDEYSKPGISEARKKALMNLYNVITNETFEANRSNYIGVSLFGNIAYDLDMAQMDSLMKLVPGAKNSSFVNRIYDSKKIEYKTRPGVLFVDFKARNPENTQDVSLSQYVGKGKYVLLDFWATWCGPCRQEFPYIRQAHELYKDKGLLVLGVNVWDKHAAFVEGVQKYDLTWNHIYASENRSATDTYGVAGIPHLILIGPDGKIISRGLRGEQMLAKLAELIGGSK